jgi:hypothetical protein
VVCSVTGLPISAPTELRVGSSKGGKAIMRVGPC